MGNIAYSIKQFIRKHTGYIIHNENRSPVHVFKELPFGIDQFEDIRRLYSKAQFNTVFDIGANIGQTGKLFNQKFPDASIWCFEPVSSTFAQLHNNLNNERIKCFQIGFGESNSVEPIAKLPDNSWSTISTLLIDKHLQSEQGTTTEDVTIRRLDDFCVEHDVAHIDYLKIDTEGYDLMVLKGAKDLLASRAASFIQVETTLNPDNVYHTAFLEIKDFLEQYDYRLFGIYDQKQWLKKKTKIMQHCNAVFVSDKLYKTDP